MEAKEVGKRIKFFREQRGLTKNALANNAGVSPTYIYQLEEGLKSPTVEYLGHICWGLGITLSEFFTDKEEAKSFDYICSLTNEQRERLNQFLKSLK